MKILKIIHTAFLCLLFSAMNAQEQERKLYTLTEFKVRDARKNGSDITRELLNEKACLLIYKYDDSEKIMFANYWEKSDSQSYGPIYDITKEESPNNEEKHKHDLYHFYWSYINTYDNKKGTAEVKLLTVYKPQGTYFEITILPENLDELVYKGIMNGNLLVVDYTIKKQSGKP